MKNLSLTNLQRLAFVVPAAHAVEPSAAPNAGWRRSGFDKTNILDRCVSMTAEKLAAAQAAAAARPSLSTRCKAALAREGSVSGSLGRRMSDNGRLL
jgi:hypothetical protein